MTDAAKKISTQARKLSPEERLELVDDILASLDEVDPASTVCGPERLRNGSPPIGVAK